MSAFSRRCVISYALVAVLSGALAAGGCAPINLHGNGFGDGTANWTGNLRPKTEKGRLAGIDERSREIERNLGIR